MEIEEIREYCLSKKAVEESFPFNLEILVFKVGGKIFVFLPIEERPVTFSAKSKPEWSYELREKYDQINGAFHLNKKHWNSVLCEGLKKSFILELIDHSYDLVFNSLTKKQKEEINNS